MGRLTKTWYAIFGTGGFGREGITLAHENCLQLDQSASTFEICFVEHRPKLPRINGYPVFSLDEFAALDGADKRFNVLVSKPADRMRIALECEGLGFRPFSIRSRLADVHPTAEIGEGAVLCQFTIVSANAKVGRHFHLNHHGYVSHDCTVGDFVTFAPAVRCNGTIEIGDLAYIGSGATIHQGTPARQMKIGAQATVGMGSVVLRSVASGSTVAGNPARILRAAV